MKDCRWIVRVDGRLRLDRAVKDELGSSWSEARSLIETGKIFVNGHGVHSIEQFIKKDDEIELRMRSPRSSVQGFPKSDIVFMDPHIIVVRKPSGISTIPFDEAEARLGNTLEQRVRQYLIRTSGHAPNASLGVVHRIDKETSGLVVFARTFAAKKKLSYAFRVHDIARGYVALIHGIFHGSCRWQSYLLDNRGDGLRGSARDEHTGRSQGQEAITDVASLEIGTAASLVACKLETGRTHQIRIHLSEHGHPLLGERVYIRDFKDKGAQLLSAPRMMLHAIHLGFAHPMTETWMAFDDEPTEDFTSLTQKQGMKMPPTLAAEWHKKFGKESKP